MSIIALIIGILVLVTAVGAVVMTVRALGNDGYRQTPNCPDHRHLRLQ